tara:strand:+ start:254 stop:526 length:273 start_codon:yes stop_codon:yes gene_type:complete
LSGGYAKHKLFPLDSGTFTIDLLRGTPRALLTKSYVSDTWEGAQLDLKIVKWKDFDVLKDLIPINNMASENNIIPGLVAPKGIFDKFPPP